MNDSSKIDDKLVNGSVILFSFIIFFFCLIVFFENNQIEHISGNYDTNSSIKWSVDKIGESFIYYQLKGWAFIPNEENQSFGINVLLRNSKTNKFLKINTDMQANFVYVDYENNIYRNAGFIATVNKYLLEKNIDYEICILLPHKGSKNIIFTNKIINV